MTAAEYISQLRNTAIEQKLEVVKHVQDRQCFVLADTKGNKYLLSESHALEMGDGIQQEDKGGKTFFIAKWRKAGQSSEWLRADEGQPRSRITLADILG